MDVYPIDYFGLTMKLVPSKSLQADNIASVVYSVRGYQSTVTRLTHSQCWPTAVCVTLYLHTCMYMHPIVSRNFDVSLNALFRDGIMSFINYFSFNLFPLFTLFCHFFQFSSNCKDETKNLPYLLLPYLIHFPAWDQYPFKCYLGQQRQISLNIDADDDHVEYF